MFSLDLAEMATKIYIYHILSNLQGEIGSVEYTRQNTTLLELDFISLKETT